jgi:hypothetical protein
MVDPSESKRDQAVEVLCEILTRLPCSGVLRLATFVDLVVEAAKEEVRAELAEDRYNQMRRIIAKCNEPWTQAFWAEWEDVKAKREAAGKNTE